MGLGRTRSHRWWCANGLAETALAAGEADFFAVKLIVGFLHFVSGAVAVAGTVAVEAMASWMSQGRHPKQRLHWTLRAVPEFRFRQMMNPGLRPVVVLVPM